jgi:hypothetical protein
MNPDFENDMFLLFNMAFDGLEKTDLTSAENEAGLEDIAKYLRENENKPQVTIINTRNRDFPKAMLFRKLVNGSVVIFAFWKRGIICEGMAASLSGVSPLNEFMWVQDAKTGKFIAKLKPKIDAFTNKARQMKMKHAAIVSVLVEPLNRREYRDIFGGDILKKLEDERADVLDNLKTRGLVSADAIDPANQVKKTEISADIMLASEEKRHIDRFVAIQKDGAFISATHVLTEGEDLQSQLMREFLREAELAEREEERQRQKGN